MFPRTFSLLPYTNTSFFRKGHSLGAAVALLDATMLKMQMPSLEVDVVTFGMPRVGNQQFADMIDGLVRRPTFRSFLCT